MWSLSCALLAPGCRAIVVPRRCGSSRRLLCPVLCAVDARCLLTCVGLLSSILIITAALAAIVAAAAAALLCAVLSAAVARSAGPRVGWRDECALDRTSSDSRGRRVALRASRSRTKRVGSPQSKRFLRSILAATDDAHGHRVGCASAESGEGGHRGLRSACCKAGALACSFRCSH